MAIPNPNPNIEDGKKCDNKTYSSNKIESLVAAATELPTPEAGDAGKVLTVNAAEDGYELDYAGHDLIDDNTASSDTVYSSSKVDSLLSSKANTADLATVATSGDYDDLLDKPIEKVTGVGFGSKIDTSTSKVNAYKVGKLCWVYGYLDLSDSISDGHILLTGLPTRAGDRNSTILPIYIGGIYLNDNVYLKSAVVDSSGNLAISIYGTAPTASEYILINGFYEIA